MTLLHDLTGPVQAFVAEHPELPETTHLDVVERVEARIPEIADRVDARIKTRITAYGDIGADASIQAVLSAVMAQARPAVVRDEGANAVFEDLARRRAAEGVPVHALMEAVQITARELIDTVAEELVRAGVPPEGVLEIRDYAWVTADRLSRKLARIYREVEDEEESRDRRGRADFVRGLVAGDLPDHRLRAGASRYGVALDRTYVAFTARPAGRRDALAIASAVLQTGARGGLLPIVEALDRELVGFAPTRPQVTGHLVGVGAPVLPASLGVSLADAREARDTAHAFGVSGTVGLEDLGPRSLVVAADRAGSRLDAQLLAALPDAEHPSEIERTVLDYITNDRSAEDTAQRHCVHVNTVRYRLGRFRELTGLDLARTDDFVTAWWLLNRRAAERAEVGAGPELPPTVAAG